MLPSASLLSTDASAEADWLSGVPTTLAFEMAGLHGLMILQLLIAVSIAVMLIRSAQFESAGLNVWLMLPALLILCNRSLPVPGSLTLLAIPLVWNIARDLQREPTPTRLVQLFVVCVLAANIAPGVLWFLAAVAIAGVLRGKSPTARFSPSVFCRILVAAAAAGCLTPRGVLAYRDAFVLAFPQTSVSRAYLIDTRFDVLAMSDDRFGIALFAVLTLLVVVHLCRRQSHVEGWACFGVLQFCAWSSAANLLPVTVLLVLLGTIEDDNSTGVSVWKLARLLQRFQPATFVVTAGLLVAVCVLGVADPDRRAGWGIAPFLDYRPLQRDLAGLDFEGAVLADDILGTGIVSLLELPGGRARDTPERALLGGRWISRWHLWNDIAHQRRMPYDRDDGTTGGWWLPLQDQDVSLLLVNSRHHRTLRALETTSWRMLSFDSSVIPFGFSGDALMSRPIMRSWNDRRVVDFGPWQYAFPSESVDWAGTDFLSLFGGQPSSQECRRLAAVFQTLGLYRASAKTLVAALGHRTSQPVVDQLRELSFQKAVSERHLASRASRWTTWLAMFPGTEESVENNHLLLMLGFIPQRVLGQPRGKFEPLAAEESWHNARSFYFDGRLDDALSILDSTDPETLYARTQLLFELAQPDAAIVTLKTLQSPESNSVLSLLATHELQSAN